MLTVWLVSLALTKTGFVSGAEDDAVHTRLALQESEMVVVLGEGLLFPTVTVMETALELPSLSVAVAVMVWLPEESLTV